VVYWAKVNYERNEYLVDLESLGSFSYNADKKITFWLPNSSSPVIISRQSDPDSYQRIWDYIAEINLNLSMGNWLKISYDRNEYLIDLDRISTFCQSPNGKLTFWLPESSVPIIITPQSDPESYQKIMNFINQKTGQSFQS
jgi:hypothetical protein